MVSPDWDTARVRVFRSRTGSRYRNSLAISISTGMRVQCSMAYLATSPAWNAVPQATTNTLSTARMASSLIRTSSRRWTPARTRPRMVSRMAMGCSWISLSMKSS
jgi:hypothetical protein